MSENRFFRPFVGRYYQTGLAGKKVLVVGNSFYCSHGDCKYFKECTDMDRKDSSRFDSICPDYAPRHLKLADAPAAELEDMYRAYKNFGDFLSGYADGTDKCSVWQYVAFTNYVQFFVPAAILNGQTAVSERDFEAFKETVTELKPDVVFIWGSPAGDAIRRNRQEVYDYDTPAFHEKDGYICHMRLDGLDKAVTLINTYHPCNMYGQWSANIPALKKYTDEVIMGI